MSSKLEELITLKDNYKKKIKAEGEEIIKEFFKEFFVNNPGVESVKWRQYTPYFNDGDPCVFSVRDAYIKLKDAATARLNLEDSWLVHVEYGKSETRNSWGGYDATEVVRRSATDEEILHGGDYDDGYYESWNFKKDSQLKKSLKELNTILGQSSDVLNIVLGDHVVVTVTPTAIESEDYCHD